VFEQPLIAELPGEQAIPEIEFSYFNPNTQQYERARSTPIKVTIARSLAEISSGVLAAAQSASGAQSAAQNPAGTLTPLTRGLRPDHPGQQSGMSELEPLYFQAPFLAASTALALILAGSSLFVRPSAVSIATKAVERTLARLSTAAQSGDSTAFFAAARETLLQTFAKRWQMAPETITVTELKSRLGPAGADIEQLFTLADEAKYSDHKPGAADFQHWIALIRAQLTGGQS
jgi:hypothetical protein